MKFKKLFLLTAVILCLALCTACGDAAHKPVAYVNGYEAYQWEYDLQYKQYVHYMESQGLDLSTEEMSPLLGMIEQDAYSTAVISALTRYLADEMEITVSEEEINQKLDDEVKGTFGTDKEYKEWMTQYGLSEQNLYDLMKTQELQTRLMEKVTEGIGIDEAAAKAVYDADPAKWDSVKTSHILFKADRDTATEEELAAAKAKAEDVIKRLNAGEDFAALATELSEDGSAANGGVIDTAFTSEDSPFVAEYTAAAYQLAKVGDYSQTPVQSRFGYHVVKLDEKRTGFEAHKLDIIEAESAESKSAAFNEYMLDKYENADVEQVIEFKYQTPEAGGGEGTDGETAGDGAGTDGAANGEAEGSGE